MTQLFWITQGIQMAGDAISAMLKEAVPTLSTLIDKCSGGLSVMCGVTGLVTSALVLASQVDNYAKDTNPAQKIFAVSKKACIGLFICNVLGLFVNLFAIAPVISATYKPAYAILLVTTGPVSLIVGTVLGPFISTIPPPNKTGSANRRGEPFTQQVLQVSARRRPSHMVAQTLVKRTAMPSTCGNQPHSARAVSLHHSSATEAISIALRMQFHQNKRLVCSRTLADTSATARPSCQLVRAGIQQTQTERATGQTVLTFEEIMTLLGSPKDTLSICWSVKPEMLAKLLSSSTATVDVIPSSL